MPNTKTVHVPHLGGIDAAYQMPCAYDACKPTLVLINSFTTTSDLFKEQFKNEKLSNAINLIAIEPLGHGQTRAKSLHFTYWDSAIMNLQVIDALCIKGKIFTLGTAQGGWIAVQMALLAPEKVSDTVGSIPENKDSLKLIVPFRLPELYPSVHQWTTKANAAAAWAAGTQSPSPRHTLSSGPDMHHETSVRALNTPSYYSIKDSARTTLEKNANSGHVRSRRTIVATTAGRG